MTKEEYNEIVERTASMAAHSAKEVIDTGFAPKRFDVYFASGVEIAMHGLLAMFEKAGNPTVNVPLATTFFAGMDFAAKNPELAKEIDSGVHSIFIDTITLLHHKIHYYLLAVEQLEDMLGDKPVKEIAPEPLTSDEE